MTKTETETTDARALGKLAEEARKAYIAALRARRAAVAHAKDCEKEWARLNIRYMRMLGAEMDEGEEDGE